VLYGNFGCEVFNAVPCAVVLDGVITCLIPPGGEQAPTTGTNDDTCTGGAGTDVIQNCETTRA
jgi:hypothetical protein